MINSKYCPQNCKWLNISEAQQNKIYELTGKKPNHFCIRYGVRLFHMLAHPGLYKCEQCLNSNIVEKSSEVN